MSKRFFAFGCSYTSYSWPTYATLLGLEYEESYNWGLTGIGNRAIAERVAEAHCNYNFGKDDIVIVQWSSHLRNDWWAPGNIRGRNQGWKTGGSVFNYINAELYGKKWIETFFYEPAYLMHTLNHILLTQGLLDSTGCTYYMTSIGDIRNMGEDLREGPGYGEKPFNRVDVDKVVDHTWETIPELRVYQEKIWNQHSDHWLMPMELFCQQHADLTFEFIDTNNSSAETFLDIHPTTTQHTLWIEQELTKKLNISNETISISKEVGESIDKLQNRMKQDKRAFEHLLARSYQFPERFIDRIRWPGMYYGF
jgi:hypothetical protein